MTEETNEYTYEDVEKLTLFAKTLLGDTIFIYSVMTIGFVIRLFWFFTPTAEIPVPVVVAHVIALFCVSLIIGPKAFPYPYFLLAKRFRVPRKRLAFFYRCFLLVIGTIMTIPLASGFIMFF